MQPYMYELRCAAFASLSTTCRPLGQALQAGAPELHKGTRFSALAFTVAGGSRSSADQSISGTDALGQE